MCKVKLVSTIILPFLASLLAGCSGDTAQPINNPPSFTSGTSAITAENSTAVMTVIASDAEGDSLTYSLSGGLDQSAFVIDGASGILIFNAAPDFESPSDSDTNNGYQVQVSVSDGTNVVSQDISVTVTNVNDIAPVFTSSTSAITAENSTAVMTVIASDAEGDSLAYSLSGGLDQSAFVIGGASGILIFNAAPDFESPSDSDINNGYQVQVSVSDGTNVVSQDISVTVTNVNDIAPIFTSSTSATTAENSAAVMTVTASDVEGDSLVYSLSGGADLATFVIDSISGALSFNLTPDFETPTDANTDNIYEVQVSVSDGTNSTFQTINVTTTNVNEAPVFTSAINAYVEETNTTVMVVTASDVEGDSLVYSLSGGADLATFVIDSISGALSFNLAPDFEAPIDTNTDNIYEVQVSVTDGAYSVLQAISVAVTNRVDETAPIVNSVSPMADSTAVDRTASIQAIFNETLNCASVTPDTFTLEDSSALAVVGDVTCSGNTVTFTSSVYYYLPLDSLTATLTTGISDLSGNALAANYQWGFTTVPWTQQLGTTSNDYAESIAVDSNDNVYVSGYTFGALDGQTSAGGVDLFVTKYNVSGVKQWTRQLGTASNDYAHGVATDSANNIYVTGETFGALDGQASAGDWDLFVTKYDASGVKLWTRQLGTAFGEFARSVTTDSANNVYVTGFTSDGLDGQTWIGSADLFVTKYNASGVKQWTRQLGTTGFDEALGATTDSANNVYVAGRTDGALDGQATAGGFDLFVTKYNASGVKQWTRQLGSPGYDIATDVSTDSLDNIYVTGSTLGALDGQATAGDWDLFVTKYNASGVKQWTRQLGTAGFDYASDITTDSTNNVYVTGQTNGALDGQTSAGGSDLFVTKYNASGVKQWTRQLGTTSGDFGYGIVADSFNDLYVTGYTGGSLDWQTSVGAYDLFVVKYTADGTKK